jgi:2',3'-cyclic-nucleotide 2'-phosphodiesterase (5'-nucleotidase family)
VEESDPVGVSQTLTTRRRGTLLLVLLGMVAVAIPAGVLAAKPVAQPTTIQLLNVSDWHGNLDPAGAAGGAWNISARWQQDRLAYPSISLTAGDDFGASPPLASFFDEVPAVKAERLMGVQVNTFGNHDFDKGIDHLQRMINLAGAPTDAENPGAPFKYVAANLANLDANLIGVTPMEMLNVAKVKVAFIGIVNEEAPTIVSPGNFGTIEITDGVAAATHYAQKARQAGANVVVVLTHKGMDTVAPTPTGKLKDFAEALPAGLVDVVIGDHTNIQYSATAANGVLYHENASYGNTYAKTLITAMPDKGGTVSQKSVAFVTPGPAGSLTANNTSCGTLTFCDQAIVDMLVPYRVALAAALDGKIGTTTLPFDRGGNIERRQEMPIGDLVADGMRLTYGVDFGYITGGSLRTQFPACSYAPVDTTLRRSNYDSTHTNIVTCSGGYASGGPYDLVKGDVYAVLPFGNNVITREITGHVLWQMLENGVSLCPNPITSSSSCQGRFPQVSGLKVTYKLANPTGCSGSETSTPPTWACQTGAASYRTQSVTTSDGTPVPDDGTIYTLATTDFTNTGGDAYFMLKDGEGVTRDRDANTFLSYMEVVGPDLDPTSFPLDRVTFVP